MLIHTFDDKKAATYDVKGLGEYLRSLAELKEHEKRVTIAKAEAYCNGYCDALYAVASILEASNYRVKEESGNAES